MNRNTRNSSTFAAVTVAAFLATASVAFACVTFKGKMVVDGNDGDTTVTGTGNSHAYCSDGYPKTAAAGHLTDQIMITVSAATTGACASSTNKLDQGDYEVRFNNRPSYAGVDTTASVDGRWTMVPLSGCFLFANESTTTKVGTFTVNSSGSGSWTGPLSSFDPAGQPAYSAPGEASNLCVGKSGPYDEATNPEGAPGMLAPYRLLAI